MSGTVVAFCAEGISHVRTLLATVEGLQARGLTVYVMTGEELRPEVESAGARFVDLYDGHPKEALEDDSIPVPQRNVTFAGAYGGQLADEVAELEPSLILYETFAVIGPVVARRLGVPHVNVIPHHASVPERAVAARRRSTAVHTSAQCLAAVERLRTVHGIEEANPFYYMEALSPFLNLYPEPEEFLDDEDRAALEPLAFFGSLAPSTLHRRLPTAARPSSQRPRRLLVSFGTILWRYFEAEALATLASVARSCAEPEVEATIALGGHAIDDSARRSLEQRNVRVVDYVDQRAALAETDVLLTHHGLNSTHEAIFQEVPMISCPFYGDQPDQASRCQELGLAVPLAAEPLNGRGVDDGALGEALGRLGRDRDGFAARLAEARDWELRTIAGREEAVDRMLEIAASTAA